MTSFTDRQQIFDFFINVRLVKITDNLSENGLVETQPYGTITHGKIVQNLSGNCTESVNFQDKISGHDITHPTDSLHVRNVFLVKKKTFSTKNRPEKLKDSVCIPDTLRTKNAMCDHTIMQFFHAILEDGIGIFLRYVEFPANP